MNNKQKLVYLSLIALTIIGILSGASYAYFSIENQIGNETVIESGTMALTFTDGSTITADKLIPGEYIEKTFSVRNTGTVRTNYDIYLSEVVNTFVNQSDLVYEIISSNGYNTSNQIQVPNTETKIINNYPIDPLQEHTYTIRITYKLTNEVQNDNMGRTFIAKINVNEYNSTNKVIVNFDNNGGEGDTTSKVLSVGDTYGELPTPTKVGYTFMGWNGKNLLNYNNLTDDAKNKDIGVDDEGFISDISPGTDGRIWGYKESNWKFNLLPGNYILTLFFKVSTTNIENGIRISKNDNTVMYNNYNEFTNQTSYSNSFILQESTDLGILIKGYDGVYQIQIEEGTTATEWEPYYVTSDVTVTQTTNHTLKAIWEPNSYEIVFDKNTNDATGTMSNQNMTYDESSTLNANTYERTGYQFGGWNTKKDGSGTTYTDEQSVSNLATSGSLTLYAMWKKAYTITNLVQNSSFENGLTNWESAVITIVNPHSISNTYKYFEDNSLERVANTDSNGRNYIRQALSFISGHTYYYFLHAYTPSSDTQVITSDIDNRGGWYGLYITNSDGWKKGGVIRTNYPYTETRYISVNYGLTSDYTYVDGIGMVDLTAAFGAGNEPSQEWCDANIDYFDGTTTVYK